MKQFNEKVFNSIIKDNFEKYINDFNKGYNKARIKNTFIEEFKEFLQKEARELETQFPVNQERYHIVKMYELDSSYNNFYQAILHYSKRPNKNFEILLKGIALQMAITFVWREVFNPDTDIDAFPVEIREYKINTKVKPVIQFFISNNNAGTNTTVLAKETKQLKLRDLFNNKTDFTQCINALHNVDVPIIDKNKKYLLGKRQKGAIVAWIEVLKFRGKIINTDKIKLAEILNNTFGGLGISSRTLSNVATTAYKKYYTKLTALIK